MTFFIKREKRKYIKRKKKIYILIKVRVYEHNGLYIYGIFFFKKNFSSFKIHPQSFGIFSCFKYSFSWKYFFIESIKI